MSGVVVDGQGRQWWTTSYAVLQLQVARHCLGDWVRRSRAAGHVAGADPADCPACPPDAAAFPHVDPPARRGRVYGYQAEQLLNVEAHTGRAGRPGRRRAL
ncbi:hypothetical protein [Solwaraspora sp. WMMD792]|uniref:hypothetical protein n=1 Tax=Solwaraspora sp. WMMD792 TaxID=3016099 RepID=UPI002417306E|nr:hypothetical protein [Solwaraspora sp. WMMD792]MDG4768762.1 hypothetical protein [Solwaraspora sp. WMMD792]MDG4768801.1 hypothetical protein [Solwaraspora sp. WMMD792]MDG4768841.1 hypothetical protein [Solwaraspora sp. WMMD792]MDG4768843.1 hypothetical protein [Solwaraspora sp. WMMD792]MDG4768904.1 hypothetical protein [Solwaraspora sp. WMMD792]